MYLPMTDPTRQATGNAGRIDRASGDVSTPALPQSMVEMRLLLNAAELALKADLIRSEKLIVGHGLQDRYDSR